MNDSSIQILSRLTKLLQSVTIMSVDSANYPAKVIIDCGDIRVALDIGLLLGQIAKRPEAP